MQIQCKRARGENMVDQSVGRLRVNDAVNVARRKRASSCRSRRASSYGRGGQDFPHGSMLVGVEVPAYGMRRPASQSNRLSRKPRLKA